MSKDRLSYREEDFQSFIDSNVPEALSLKIKDRMLSHVRPPLSLVMLKYSTVFLLSASLSLFLCPQKGFGFLDGQYPLFFHFLHQNVVVCGIYCGVIFGMITHGAALLILNHYEQISIRKKYPWVSAVWFAVAYSVFMIFGTEHYINDIAYSLAWIVSVAALVLAMNRLTACGIKGVG